jgi:hypothetical protein
MSEETKFLYLVATADQCWGRGTTPKEAAEKAIKAGSRKTSAACCYVIVGAKDPEEVYIDDSGYVCWPTGTDDHKFRVKRVSALLGW